ncbi:MAG: hypothetical protein WA177_05615, partial [Xanthobacteraceae bacterium]
MRSLCCLIVAAAALMAATVPPAMAQPAPQSQSCTGNPNVDPDVQIESCTALIATSHGPPRDLAVAYSNRGDA